jgi:hypothetical protein
MDCYELPDCIEPIYWNVVFHPAKTRLARLLLGRFDHVSAFAYVPGYKVWIVYDNQWGGTRISFVAHGSLLVSYIRNCSVIRFNRVYKPMVLMSRFGFYCVPAVKSLLGLSCVAATPDQLYRHLVNNGGELIGQRVDTAAAAAGSDAQDRARTGPG